MSSQGLYKNHCSAPFMGWGFIYEMREFILVIKTMLVQNLEVKR